MNTVRIMLSIQSLVGAFDNRPRSSRTRNLHS
jgi:hypothetical protein